MRTWRTQEAKGRLSELLRRAEQDGPQAITRHGQLRAVLMSIEDYRRMVEPRQRVDLRALLLGGPKIADFDSYVSRE